MDALEMLGESNPFKDSGITTLLIGVKSEVISSFKGEVGQPSQIVMVASRSINLFKCREREY